MPRKGSPYAGSYERERRQLLGGRPLCVHCLAKGRRVVATQADHQPPIALHARRHREGSGCCRLVPSCEPCQREQALALALHSPPAPVPAVELEEDPVGFGVDDAVWDVAPWLDDLREVPPDAVWPRLMTVPHPDAVDSLGGEFVAWCAGRGTVLRWFQRLVVTRLLEVDAAGRLVWAWLLGTLSRQVGKSTILRELALWRIHQAGRFGQVQDVLHIANQMRTGKEVMRPAQVWAKRQVDEDGGEAFDVKLANESVQIERLGCGSRWILRTPNNVYSFTAALALIDEAWAILPAPVEEGVAPTLVAVADGQLVLFSTAHRRATLLCLGRRRLALDELGSGRGGLLVEWSAPADMPVDDRAGWRMASPHWDRRREQFVADRLAFALSDEFADPDEPDPEQWFRAQWLNQWPRRPAARAGRGQRLVDESRWEAAGCDDDSIGPLVIGLDDHEGRGAAVGFAGWLDDGRVVVGGELCVTRADAYELAALAAGRRRGSVLVVAAALAADPDVARIDVMEVRKATGTDTTAALATLREALTTGAVVHDRSPALTDQVLGARVVPGVRGLGLVVGQRVDLVRAVLWAMRVAVTMPVGAPAVHWPAVAR